MTHPIIKRRRAEQREKIAVAQTYADQLATRFQIERAWVVGSVARGDFNVWSDIDVVVVTHDLPDDVLRRADLFLDKPVSVQVVAYTPDELQRELERRNPLVTEAATSGIALIGNEGSF